MGVLQGSSIRRLNKEVEETREPNLISFLLSRPGSGDGGPRVTRRGRANEKEVFDILCIIYDWIAHVPQAHINVYKRIPEQVVPGRRV
jgi:hypothetical protein